MQCIDMGTLEGMPGLGCCVILPKEDHQALSVMAEILSVDKPDVVMMMTKSIMSVWMKARADWLLVRGGE